MWIHNDIPVLYTVVFGYYAGGKTPLPVKNVNLYIYFGGFSLEAEGKITP